MALLKETTKKIITVKINNSTMKRIFMLAAVAVMTMSALSLNAQNKFKGIIKYTMTSSGEVAIDIPASQAESEAKVMGEKFVFGDMMQDGREVTNYVDFSQYIAMLGSQGVELETYRGEGKFYITETVSQSTIDSLTIPCTEGFYVEYLNETKTICDMKAKLARVHSFDEEGKDHPMDIWYCDEIGPAVNFALGGIGIKGAPLQFSQQLDDNGHAITLTATKIIKGKVKDVDFLNRAGFKEGTKEELLLVSRELKEAIDLMQD